MDSKVISTGIRYLSLPDSYVRPESERPRLSEVKDCENVPLIDLGCEDRSLIVRKICSACQTYGFFQVINHGVSMEAEEKMLKVANEFFSLPVEKLKLYSDDSSKTMSLSTGFNVKKEKDHNGRDYLRLDCYLLDKHVPEWPSNPPSFKRDIVKNYCMEVREMGSRLRELIAESLGLEKDHIKNALGEQGQHMAVNYCLTILLQDPEVAGLQILKDGKWMAVKPYPNAFVIDIGDQLQANDFKNKEFILPHPPSWPSHNMPKRKRANRKRRISFVNAMLYFKEQCQKQEELNNSKNRKNQSEILKNHSKSEIEAIEGLLNLSKQMPYYDVTNEDKAMESCLRDFSKHRFCPKRPYSATRDEENGDQEKKKMKTKKEKTSVLHGPNLPPKLPANFKERIKEKGGSSVALVIQKKIFDSDVNDGLNRLSIPESKVKNEFLNAEEKAELLSKDQKGKHKHIEVVMIGPSSPQDEYKINLTKWELKKGGGKKSSWTYNLITTWKKVVKENNLEKDMIVQLWSYRVDSKLNFALVIC